MFSVSAAAAFADVMMQFFGLASVAVLLPMILWGFYLLRGRPVDRVVSRLCAWFGGSILVAAVLACVPAPDTWPLPTGLGGVFGDMILKMPSALTGDYPTGFLATVLAVVLAMPATWLMLFAALLIAPPVADDKGTRKVARARMQRVDDEEEDEDDGGRAFGPLLLGAATHFWLIGRAHLRRLTGRVAENWPARPEIPYDFNEEEFTSLNGEDRVEPEFAEVGAGPQKARPPAGQ